MIEIVSPDSAFVASLLTRIAIIRQLHESGVEDIPTAEAQPDLIANLCNVAFWSSLQQEERRNITATIAIASPDTFRNPLLLKTPVPFNIASVTAFAPAAKNSVLGVHLGGSDLLEVWGIANRPKKLGLSVTISKPGTIAVFLDYGPIPIVAGLINDGQLIIPNDASILTFQDILADSFMDRSRESGSRFRRAGQLIEIIHAMTHHKHGGTLVSVPIEPSWRAHVLIHYPCGNDTGSDFLKEHAKASFESEQAAADPASDTSLYLDQRARKQRYLTAQALRRVGQLTAVDGAVIIQNDFVLHGFGAKLKPPENEFEIIGLDALTGNNKVLSIAQLGGTRHQSAVRFVHANPGSMAVISSQDGHVTLVGRTQKEPAVVAVQSVQHLLTHWRDTSARY